VIPTDLAQVQTFHGQRAWNWTFVPGIPAIEKPAARCRFLKTQFVVPM
jgi:hypothetical protein